MRKSVAIILLMYVVTQAHAASLVHRIVVNGVINPVAAEYIAQAVERAESEQAEALLIQLDTPGGLMASMHEIMKSIQGARVPVIVYVAPSGARAASAGVFITYSAHIAAMAPATNIGSAHPVFGGNMPGSAQTDTLSGSIMMEKVTNDAIAKIKAVAQSRGRNAEWAEQAIRESANITAEEALKKDVIDYIAATTEDLMTQLDGRMVTLDDNSRHTLRTAAATVITYEMTWRQRLLDIITNPNVAYILMMIGTMGIMFELYNPGSIVPGVAGGIALITGFFALNTLPVDFAGYLLILFAIILFILEIKITSYGILSIGGVVALLIGSIMLFKSPLPELRASLQVVLFMVVIMAAFFLFVIGLALKAQKKRPLTGMEAMVGKTGKVTLPLKPTGTILVHGEYWRARAEDAPLKKGTPVRIVGVDDEHLLLKVRAEDQPA
ncbi:MAG: nodulation protein NfeD [Calditrichaeota bacterium]|nr:MAG: nodulation protein NfeD [Calditrichota bacterium]